MIRRLLLAAVLSLAATGAQAAACSVPFALTTDTLADANKVMANFNALANCVNNVNTVTSYPGVDPTGATDSSVGTQNAINAICGIENKSMFFPGGTYKFLNVVTIPTGCALQMWGVPGTATLMPDAANANTDAQLIKINQSENVGIGGLTLDGNVSGGNVNGAELVQVNGPSDGFWYENNKCQNTFSDCVVIVGEARRTGALTVRADEGQPVLEFAAVPAGVKPGAQAIFAFINPNVYVTVVGATTLTLNENLTDTLTIGRIIGFTAGFTISANAYYGDLTLATADTSGLLVGQTIFSNTTPQCVQSRTKIVSITLNASVTIDRKVICDIASGDLMAAARGNSDITIANSTFRNVAQPQIAGSAAPASYNTVGIQASGQPLLTLACRSGAGCNRAGVVPGQTTAATNLPAGVPASTLIIGGPTSIDSPVGTYTVRLAANLTAAVPDATAIPFQVSRGGRGFGVWYSFGAWFANRDSRFLNNTFYHNWIAPLFINSVGYTLLQGNSYVMDGMEFVDPTIAASPCVAMASVYHATIVGESCKGASGNGFEINHPVGLTISSSQFVENGKQGVTICNGRDIAIGGGSIFRNNGQYKNRPFINDQDDLGYSTAGVKISGGCTFAQPGTMSNVTIDNIVVADDQVVPTQEYGIGWRNVDTGFVNLKIGSNVTGSGNSIEFIESILKLTTPLLWTSSGSWTVPWTTTKIEATSCGGGGAGGSVSAAVAAAGAGMAGVCVVYDLSVTPGATMPYVIGAGGTPGAAGPNNGGQGTSSTFGGITAAAGAGGLGIAAGNAAGRGVATQLGVVSTSSSTPTVNSSIKAMFITQGLGGSTSTGGAGSPCLWGPSVASVADSDGTAATGQCGGGSGAGSAGGAAHAGGAGAPGAIYIRPRSE